MHAPDDAAHEHDAPVGHGRERAERRLAAQIVVAARRAQEEVAHRREALGREPLRRHGARAREAERLRGAERDAFLERLRTVARICAEEFGLIVTMHAHAAGFVEFEDELEDVLQAIGPGLLGVCLDTGHSVYAGFDPVAFYRRHGDRVRYLHFKDVNPRLLKDSIANRTGFYDACAAGIFCTLGDGCVDFLALKRALEEAGCSGWGTIEQDRDPKGARSTLADATANLNYLKTVGLA